MTPGHEERARERSHAAKPPAGQPAGDATRWTGRWCLCPSRLSREPESVPSRLRESPFPASRPFLRVPRASA
jgi:hypothetical protein